jgi:WD40 repeat protein
MLNDVSHSNINYSYNSDTNPPSLTQIHSLDISSSNEQPVNCILPLSTGAIAFGLGNGKIELYELSTTHKHLLSIYNIKKAHKSSILDLIELSSSSSNSNCTIASCSSDKKIIIWRIIDNNTFTIEHQIPKAHDGKIPRIVYIASKNHLISCSYDCTIKIWDCSNKYNYLYTLNKHIKEVISIVYNEHHNTLFSAGKEGVVRVWKASDYTSVYKLNDTYVYSSRNMITYNKDYVVLCTGNKIIVVNVKSYVVEKDFNFDFYGVINCLMSVPNNNGVIALGSEKGHIILLNINNKATSIEVENTHSNWVTCIGLMLCASSSSSTDNDVAIVSSSCDGTVKVWK